MIRINLLGIPRQKKGKRGSAAAVAMMPDTPGEGPNALIFLVLGLIVGIAGIWYLNRDVQATADKQAVQLTEANRKGADWLR